MTDQLYRVCWQIYPSGYTYKDVRHVAIGEATEIRRAHALIDGIQCGYRDLWIEPAGGER